MANWAISCGARMSLPLLLVLGSMAMVPVLGDERSRPEPTPGTAGETSSPQLDEVVDEQIDVELLSGAKYEKATLLRVVNDGDGAPKSVRVRLENGKSRTIRMAAVRVVSLGGKELYRSADNASAKPKSRKEQKAEEEAKQKAKEHEQWLGRLTARGIKPWGDFTPEEHTEAIEAHKKQYEEVSKVIPGMYLVETEQYLFFSNAPQNVASMYIGYLDDMYKWMRHAYGLEEGVPVWRGKAAVYVFNTKEQFAHFEAEFMNNPDAGPKGAQGVCHSDSKRVITIACFLGPDPDYFAAVLVHETSHGFVACYKTPVRLPSWVNEGMAENTAMMLVTKDKGVRRKIDRFIATLRETPNPRLGEDFFVVGENIQHHYYGGASSMVRFMMQTDQKKFVKFVDLLKEGMPWEEALQGSYSATKEELVAAYGRWIEVPNLQL